MKLLDRTECSALRGFAITGIFMHNFLHWLNPMVKENEYLFHQKNVDWMYSVLTHPDGNLLWQLFSFFGHYGVPVFLFLSGYGLVLKYEKQPQPMAVRETGNFMWHHYCKLFPMMLLGFVAFAMIDWITPGHHYWSWNHVLTLLTMTINLFPEPDKNIWPGPYWFFGLIMQLYLIYILVMHRYRHWGVTLALVILCWGIQALCYADPEGNMLNSIRYNSIGGILPFTIGVTLARLGETRLSIGRTVAIPMLCVSGALTMLFSLTFHTWLWVPALIVVFNVALIKSLPQLCIKGLDWLGALSAAIFVCHPITRKIFIPISRGCIEDGLTLYVVSTIMLAMLFKMAIAQLKKEKQP